jgi:hypothetical protein
MDIMEKGHVEIRDCDTKDMVADILTKALGVVQFTDLKKKSGLISGGTNAGGTLKCIGSEKEQMHV